MQCRSPRMSPSSISSGQPCPRARPRARRGSRAAPAGCTACRAARRPPPRSRTRAVSPLSSSATPYSLTCRPRRTASVRSASLCLPEPVKCWSRLPKASSGTIRRSTGRPLWVTRPGARLAGRRDRVDHGQPAERLRQRGRVARRRDDVEVLARCRPCAARCRRAPPGSRPGARAARPPAPRRRAAPSRAACAPSGGRRRPPRAPPARSPPPSRRSPARPSGCPPRPRARSSSIERHAELVVEQAARASGRGRGCA